MRSIVPLALVLGLLALVAGARAEDGQDIELSIEPEDVEDARPGDEITLTLLIESTFWREVEVALSVEPEDDGDDALEVDLSQDRVLLAANASVEVSVSVRVHAEATGDHGLRFRADAEETSDEASVELRIAETDLADEDGVAEDDAPGADDGIEASAPQDAADPPPVDAPPSSTDDAASSETDGAAAPADPTPETLPAGDGAATPPAEDAAQPPATSPSDEAAPPPTQPAAADPAQPETDGPDDMPVEPVEVPADAALPAPLASSGGRDERIILAAASVATGSLALLAARLARRGGWLAALLAPLYTRIARSRVTEQPTRAQILEAIRKHPGITFRALQRELALAAGEVTHHTRLLTHAGVIFASQAGQERRFFLVAQGYVAPVPSVAERALELLARGGPRTSAELARDLGVSRPALRYHLVRLEQERRVELVKQGRDVLVTLHAPGSGQPASQQPST